MAPFALVLAGACGGRTEPEPPHGVVLLLFDTVRADHLSAYGYEQDTTPRLERLAARGTRFDEVQASAPWTVPSVASLWTGLHPTQHGAGIHGEEARSFDGPGSYRLFDSSLPTLVQRMRARGYRTYGRIANPLVGGGAYTDDFDEVEVGRAAAGELVAWVEERADALRAQPFFLYVHFMDAHVPLEPPPEHRERYLSSVGAQRSLRGMDLRRWEFEQASSLDSARFHAYSRAKQAVYDGALRYLDEALGRLLDVLQDAGVLDATVVAVTSDHGEEFWDHWEIQRGRTSREARPRAGYGHGHTLFQELLRVPLVLAGPGVPRGRVVAARVRLLDLGPTLLELASPERAPETLGEGRSLVAHFEEEAAADAAVYSESLAYGFEHKSLVDASGFKLIRAPFGDEEDLLFDLRDDPGEQHDLLAERSDVAERLRSSLEALGRRLEAERHAPAEALPTGAGGVDLQVLRELGYAGD